MSNILNKSVVLVLNRNWQAVNYARVPKKRPRFSARGIRQRDGNRCQYTGAVLKPDEGSIDHVVLRSRGGPNSWDNCVWASKRVNAQPLITHRLCAAKMQSRPAEQVYPGRRCSTVTEHLGFA